LLNLPGLFLHEGAHWLNHYLSGAAGLGLIEHPEAAVNTTLLLMGVASAVSIAVLIWAYATYAKQGSLAKADSDLKGWELLSSKKLYWDELYHALITKPAEWLGEQLKQVIEIKVLNAGIFGLAALTEKTGNQVRKLQNGLVSSYLFWMVIGLIMLIVSYLINTIHWN
jgi:NADH-quinone oxidoreductase subunit L